VPDGSFASCVNLTFVLELARIGAIYMLPLSRQACSSLFELDQTINKFNDTNFIKESDQMVEESRTLEVSLSKR